MNLTAVGNVTADGVDIFYRYAGPRDAPVILLLRGFPSSNFMFRNLIPLLAFSYRVIAPDLPGFSFTHVPSERNFQYTFIGRFAMWYIFDYGAPTGLRMALERPGARDRQLDLLYDYRTNVALYPRFQAYLRDARVSLLAAWGRNDAIFLPPGAEAFARDVCGFELCFLDAVHFALETNNVEMAGLIDRFLKKHWKWDRGRNYGERGRA
ncbi:alpha/beta-hydrolase [Biscogniauxia sp. FL1348]|nr:alpha/beta-hydrolase [Biscogniauxia sp. FL1348]